MPGTVAADNRSPVRSTDRKGTTMKLNTIGLTAVAAVLVAIFK